MSTEIYKIGESFDSSNAAAEQPKILDIVNKGNNVVLDLSGCKYVSSAGLRVLLYTYKVAAPKGQKVSLAGVSTEIRCYGDDRFRQVLRVFRNGRRGN